MSAEHRRGEPEIDCEHAMQLGVGFRPYRESRRFCIPGEGNKPLLVPEQYSHVLALRKQVSIYGIHGVIDLISEDPYAIFDSMLAKGSRGVETPLGFTHFESIYRGEGNEEFTQRPYILRVSFLVRTPNDYAKLLITYVDVKLGEEQYLLLWNQSRPKVKRCMQRLEENSDPLLVVEKNLFNIKEMGNSELEGPITEEEKDRHEKEDLGRCTFVWLPKNLKKFKTIEFTSNQFGGEGNQEQPTEPIEPEQEPLPVLV